MASPETTKPGVDFARDYAHAFRLHDVDIDIWQDDPT